MKSSSAANSKPAFKVGTRLCYAGREQDAAAVGTVVSFDWLTEMYKVTDTVV